MLPDCKEYDKMFENSNCYKQNTYDEGLDSKSLEDYLYPQPYRAIVNNKTTVVFFDDGSKTMVRRMKGEDNNLEFAVAMAIVKRFVPNHSLVEKIVSEIKLQPDKRKKNEYGA